MALCSYKYFNTIQSHYITNFLFTKKKNRKVLKLFEYLRDFCTRGATKIQKYKYIANKNSLKINMLDYRLLWSKIDSFNSEIKYKSGLILLAFTKM